MPKLNLKRTPEEEEHQLRKERKAARKAAKAGKSRTKLPSTGETNHDDENPTRPGSGYPYHKRQRTQQDRDYDPTNDPYESDSDEEYGPQLSTSYAPNYEAIRAQLEEERFREKMYGAFEDDAGIYGVEERLNEFVHIPERWRGAAERGKGVAKHGLDDPMYMDDDEYAEWIRTGMWKKKHAEEHAEQLRKEAKKAERRAREKVLKAESLRLERAMEEERKKRKEEKERRRWDEAREEYEKRWKELIAGRKHLLGFQDIPWPVYEAQSSRNSKRTHFLLSVDHLTPDAISVFVLPGPSSTAGPKISDEIEKKDRRDRLRETMLRFHPDKFEGRVMAHVRKGDEEKVREGVGRVARALNGLMGEAR